MLRHRRRRQHEPDDHLRRPHGGHRGHAVLVHGHRIRNADPDLLDHGRHAADATSGVISGTPTTPGTYTFTVTASNGTAPDASATYTVVIAAPTVAVAAGEQLAESGSDLTLPIVLGGALLAAGTAFFFIARGARIARRR